MPCRRRRRESDMGKSSRTAPARTDEAPLSRRAMIGGALGAAAGVVGAGLLAARPATAADADPVKAGQTTLAEHGTQVKYDGAGPFNGVVLLGNDSGYTGVGSAYPAACGGWAGVNGSAGPGLVENGVYGFTS